MDKVAAELTALLALVKSEQIECLDVRLVSDEDGVCWFATGDVGFDIVHGAACEATTLTPEDDTADMLGLAQYLVDGVADQLAELES